MTKKYWETWPKVAITREKHGEGIYLLNSLKDFVELVKSTVTRWADEGQFEKSEWYTFASYEEYFQKHIGMTVEEYKNGIHPLSDKNPTIKELKARAVQMPRSYQDNNFYLQDLKTIEKFVETGKYTPGLYGILSNLQYNHQQKFEVKSFDTI